MISNVFALKATEAIRRGSNSQESAAYIEALQQAEMVIYSFINDQSRVTDLSRTDSTTKFRVYASGVSKLLETLGIAHLNK